MSSTSKLPKGKTCAVAVCPNPKTRDGFMYHTFPKVEAIREVWISKCKRLDEFNPSTSRVCSNHFLPSDYKRDLPNELLGLPPRKVLKPDAIPSQNLFSEKDLIGIVPVVSKASLRAYMNNKKGNSSLPTLVNFNVILRNMCTPLKPIRLVYRLVCLSYIDYLSERWCRYIRTKECRFLYFLIIRTFFFIFRLVYYFNNAQAE